MRQFFLTFCLVLSLCLPLSAWGQDAGAPDYKAWEDIASATEQSLQDGAPDDAALENVRSDLVEWRSQFLGAQSANSARIDTLRAQISSLGPEPAEGEEEPENIAERRKELATQLELALAPVRNAEESFTRADGLIGEIDRILIARQTDALMELGPTPLNPVDWPQAIADLTQTGLTAWYVVIENTRDPRAQATLKANAATIFGLILLGLLLLVRGRSVSLFVTGKIKSWVRGKAGRAVSDFISSIGQVILPTAGLFALTEAAKVSGLLGERGVAIFDALPTIGLCYFIARWLSGQALFDSETSDAVFDLTPLQTREASGHLGFMAVMYGINLLLAKLAVIDGYAPETLNVLRYPLVVISALSLFRLALIFAAVDRAQQDDVDVIDGSSPTFGFVTLVTNTAVKIMRVAAPLAIILGAIGYMSAASGIVFPFVLTLWLLALLLVLSRFVSDLYNAIARNEDGQTDGLIPVLVSIVLVACSLPIFALIWGARVEQLWEIWARVKQGVPLGDAQLSITNVLTFLIVFAIGFGMTRLLKTALSSTILPKTKIDKGGQTAIVSGTGYVGIFLAAIFAIMAAGIDLSALALVAGALSVGIGFGLQNIVQNFVSGIILLIERPVSEGDWIEVGGQMGFVRNISVRSTRVETFDRTDVIVPNADLISNSVTNYTRGNSLGRVTLKVGVAYGTDTRKVEGLLRDIISAQPGVVKSIDPQVLFMGFGADALDFEVRAILYDVKTLLKVTSDVNHEIAQKFSAEGIEIPFAQRDIWLRNPEALRGDTPPKAPSQPQEKTAPEITSQDNQAEIPIEDQITVDVPEVDADGDMT
ncbi:small-conductance mechanosensitive channel [Pacificibacter maritimus]|uniref:Small-conductance mechanosensitive channel n=1 Tax=Pacificibacter maritimus TaxID=762213 RepID=A0A3N4UMU3_9RHOB|nr:DUF3772 domain-containing protein [Pacificibacter maritimus]RPE71338.1 small-conductance mechanosensitive channel [Pacificibacter maritimus]